jgi:adenylylsulfate kinase
MAKILVMGLPGSGKTTLAIELARNLRAAHFNADEIRREINKDLGFGIQDRIEQARRMGILCDITARSGAHVIADFVCPTPETRAAFGNAFIVWVDRISSSRFEDTNHIFLPPEKYDYRVTTEFDFVGYHAQEIANKVEAQFSVKRRPKVAVSFSCIPTDYSVLAKTAN